MSPAPAAFPLSRQDVQLLAQLGFIAADAGQRGTAVALFAALRVVRPDAVAPLVGLALADMGVGRHAEAARFLRDEALREHPGDAELSTFLGLALAEAGRVAEARPVLRSVVDRERAAGNAAQPCVRLALRLLESFDSVTNGPSAARPMEPPGARRHPIEAVRSPV